MTLLVLEVSKVTLYSDIVQSLDESCYSRVGDPTFSF